jgi:hypothetical protein
MVFLFEPRRFSLAKTTSENCKATYPTQFGRLNWIVSYPWPSAPIRGQTQFQTAPISRAKKKQRIEPLMGADERG